MRILLVLAALTLSSLAQADAKSEIAYRQGIFSSVGGHMKAMGTILRGGVHKEDLGMHAAAMADLAEVVPNVFPEGSDDGKTSALPEIWSDPETFKAAVDKFVSAAKGIDMAVKSGDMGEIGGAMKELGGSCKNCHDNFKAD